MDGRMDGYDEPIMRPSFVKRVKKHALVKGTPERKCLACGCISVSSGLHTQSSNGLDVGNLQTVLWQCTGLCGTPPSNVPKMQLEARLSLQNMLIL